MADLIDPVYVVDGSLDKVTARERGAFEENLAAHKKQWGSHHADLWSDRAFDTKGEAWKYIVERAAEYLVGERIVLSRLEKRLKKCERRYALESGEKQR